MCDASAAMPSYRFCRPDTIPLLVEALNACWAPHFPDEPEMTVERFRNEMRELDVWPSNSMVAIERDDPIAVIIGTKREHEVLIHRLAVAPDHQRQGHGSHLVMSLSHKLAVLGPPKLVAEVPSDNQPAQSLFTALGFHRETPLTDWQLDTSPSEPEAAGRPLADSASVQSQLETSAIRAVPAGSLLGSLPEITTWHRSPRTLQQSAPRLQAFTREDAWLILDPNPQPPHVLASAGPDDPLTTLLSDLATVHGGTLLLPRYSETELPPTVHQALRLTPTRRYDRLVAAAEPA